VDDSAAAVTRACRGGAGALLLASCALTAACATRRPVASDYGVPPCPPEAADRLLSDEALQCWFQAPRGRWRTLKQESHFDVLVVRVEARDSRDAGDIARRFVAAGQLEFSEILLYVQPEPPADPTAIRRVRWTRESGFETLDFSEHER
jgi:hypothetical protein